MLNIRVLDLSLLLPGPYCSLILADLGAEVIKIERPGGGDWMRHVPPLDENGCSAPFAALNRGKKSLALDLKAEMGREIFLELVATADVLLESFRPGVMERLGLGYARLAECNPGLVYCALTGYGLAGPYRQRAGHDLNFLGLTGLLDLNGPPDGPLIVPAAQFADMSGALWALVGIQAALLERQHSGRGQRVDATLLGGALSLLTLHTARLQGGQSLQRGRGDLSGGVVCYNLYQTKDGAFMTLAALEPHFWAAFCRAVGSEAWLEDQYAPAAPGERVYEEICALFRAHTRAEWVDILAQVDACCEPVYSLAEALDSAPVQALGMVAPIGLLPAFQLSAFPWQTAAGGPPALGEHTASLLIELGCSASQIEKLQVQGII